MDEAITEICKYIKCSGIDLIGPVVIILAAVIAWCQHRRIAAKRATLDFLLKYEVGNREWREMRLMVREILDDKERSRAILHPQALIDCNHRGRNDRLMVGTFLSHCEFIAVAIRHKTMHGGIYKEWNGPGYVRMYDRAEKYIDTRRRSHDTRNRYKNFENLANKWRQQ